MEKPARWQAPTILGFTMMTASVHFDQNRRIRPRISVRRQIFSWRFCRRWRAAGGGEFSKTRSRREHSPERRAEIRP